MKKKATSCAALIAETDEAIAYIGSLDAKVDPLELRAAFSCVRTLLAQLVARIEAEKRKVRPGFRAAAIRLAISNGVQLCAAVDRLQTASLHLPRITPLAQMALAQLSPAAQAALIERLERDTAASAAA